MKTTILLMGLALASPFAFADDVADVKAAELALNAAQNEGRFEEMFNLMLRTRTTFAVNGGKLLTGWSEADVQRRKDDWARGRRSDIRVENLEVQVIGDTAITSLYRIGTEIAAGSTEAKPIRYRFSGVWLRTKDGWKLAHRHESPLTQ